MFDKERWYRYRDALRVKDFILLLFFSLLSVLSGWILFGSLMAALISLTIPILFTFHIKTSSKILLKLYGGVEIGDRDAPELFEVVRFLCMKAKIEKLPKIYLLSTEEPNAFTFEDEDHFSLAISGGLLQIMNRRELVGVLAHEISHISNKDPSFLKVTNALYSFISFASNLIHMSLLLFLPFYLIGSLTITVNVLLTIMIAPTVLRLLILAIMRNREFSADLWAVKLTGDPLGLAFALSKLGQREGSVSTFIFPYRIQRKASIFDTHPLPNERIRRLKNLDSNNL